MTPDELAAIVAAVRAGIESPAEKKKRETAEWCADMARIGRERGAKEAEEAKQKAEELRRNPPPRSPSLGPPCPFASLPPAALTVDQRYSLGYWDSPDPVVRDRARAFALPPGELSDAAVKDIARHCAEHLVHDEYATMHVSALRHSYDASPAAKSTKGASDQTMIAAFVAGGLLQEPGSPSYFHVRLEADDELGFSTSEAASPHNGQQWIVPELIPTGCQVVIVGDQAAGKTTMAASLLAAVANGRPWLGRPTIRSQCAIINFDGRDADLRQLLHEAGAEGKVSIASYPEFDLTDPRFWAALERRFGNGKPACIAIDSLSRGSGDVDEKDARFAASILRAAEISSRHPITFPWLHHCPVTVRGNSLNDWLRGTSALGAAFDIGFGLSKVSATRSPRETIIKVETLKMRPKGITPPVPFKLRLTDAGLSLYDETKRKAPFTVDEKVLATLTATPGLTSAGIEKAIGGRRESIIEARDRLEAAGAIDNQGSTSKPRWYAL